MTGAREPRICRGWDFDHAESFHLNPRGKEAMRTVEKFHARDAFTDEKNPFWLYVRRVCRRSFDSDYAARFILDMSVSAIAAGVSATAIPAASRASIFPAAVPFPPEMIAPA